MKIPCEYCGQMIPETAHTCPHCGAANTRVKRTAYGVPATIEELRAYCQQHNLPLQDMRVFLGEDYRGARAFGIYRDETTGNFVVYKNKADGTRAVRYEGDDEAYAVNELYQKIRERVSEQKRHMGAKGAGGTNGSKAPGKVGKLPGKIFFGYLFFQVIIMALVLVVLLWCLLVPRTSRGYYHYQDHTYYYDSNWYEWDDYGDTWQPAQVDRELKENADDYYQSYGWRDSYEAGDFTESSYYSEKEWEDDDWDSSSDWDSSDSWDSSYDDWDSDW